MVNAVGITDQGRVRENNQDCFDIMKLNDTDILAVVCDGMGGVNGGSIASEMAVEAICDNISRNFRDGFDENEVKSLLEVSVTLANSKILERARREENLTGMGTTCVAALIHQKKIHLVHVGDSRAYLVRRGEIFRLTRDHSMVQFLVERGDITEEEAKQHPKKNLITRAVGVGDPVDIEYSVCDAENGDLILLCTDGLTNLVSDEEILESTVSPELELVPHVLINRANDAGGTDNITAVVISYHQE